MNRDKNKIAFDAQLSVRHIDDNGYLHVALTPISKACVNPYLGRELPGWEEEGLDPDRIYYGLRDPEELEKAASTFNGLPLLLDHHTISADNPQKDYTVGSTGTDAVFEAPYLKNSMSVTDAEAIAAIEDGTAREISCAYRFTPDFTAGEYDVGNGDKVHYDFIMREISGNHVALVAEGRAGADVAVADSMPHLNIKQRGTKQMTKRQRITAFKRRRNGLAQDANLGIEASEVTSAGFLKAVNVIEAQVEGYDPREVGLDIDANATVDEIVAKFMPGLDDESKEAYRGILTKLKGADVADEDIEKTLEDDDFEEGVKYGEKLEKDPAERRKLDSEHESEGMEKALDEDVKVEDDELDEKMKDPAFKAAFEMGVKYGEKREKADPKRIDRDHEREGEKRALGEDTIAKVKSQVAKEMRVSLRALNNAAAKVRPIVGTIQDPMAFDSAEDIYAFALRQAGKDPANYSKAAYAGMVDILLDAKAAYPIANDSAFGRRSALDEVSMKAFERLEKIQ